MSRFFAIFFSFFFISAIGSFALAQSNFDSLTGTAQPEISLSPAYPEPREEFVAAINSFGNYLSGSDLTWLNNGIEIPNSKNQRELKLQAGQLGEIMSLSLRIVDPNGTVQSVQKNIRPLYLDIIIEPQTHVPAFYTGRALPSPGSQTNATALLFGAETPTTNLVYTWTVNQTVLGGGGQRSQNKTSFETPQDSEIILSLRVSNLQGETIASRSTLIPTVRPMLKFYEINTLYGLIERPITDFFLIGNSATIQVEPYYLDSRVYNNPDIATWEINNQTVAGNNNPYEIAIQKAQGRGSSNISFRVQSTTSFLQGASGNLSISY